MRTLTRQGIPLEPDNHNQKGMDMSINQRQPKPKLHFARPLIFCMKKITLGMCIVPLFAAFMGMWDLKAQTQQTRLISYVFGGSKPKDLPIEALIDSRLLTRAIGGERFTFHFQPAASLTRVTLQAHSSSGYGEFQIHSTLAQKDGESKLEQLDRRGLRLRSGQVHTVWVQSSVLQLQIQAEGYYHDDSTLLVQIESYEEIAPNCRANRRPCIRVYRGQNSGPIVPVDETDISKLTITQVKRLFEMSTHPTREQLLSSSWQCSAFSSTFNKPQINLFFMNFYVDRDENLRSVHSNEREHLTNLETSYGWEAAVPPTPWRGCSDHIQQDLNSSIVTRLTPAGNLVRERSYFTYQLRAGCPNAPDPLTENYLATWGGLSALDPVNRAGSYLAVCSPY